MGSLTRIFYAVCIFTPILANTNVTQSYQTSYGHFDHILARTAALEARLNEEIAKREALEKEVQSKNDLTEFLRRDVLMMNKTLRQEKQRWTQFGTSLSQLENKVENLKSTFEESSGTIRDLSRDLHALDTRLSNQIITLNDSFIILQKALDFNLASIQNTSLLFGELSIENNNHTQEIIGLQASFSLLNRTLISEVMQVSTTVSSVSTNATLQQRAIDTLMRKVGELSTDLVNQNNSIFQSQSRLIMDITQLNKTAATASNQYMSIYPALNASLISLRAEVSRVQSTDNTKLDQLSRDVSGLQTKVNQYRSLTVRYNNTLDNIAAKLNQLGQAGNADAYFFATKPRSMLTTNQPPFFSHVISNVGHAFDASRSLFTCAISGVYMFTATIQKGETEPNPRVMCWLKRNGELLVAVDAHSAFIGSSPSATNSIVLPLSKGDIVQLTQCTGAGFISAEGSSFSGVLLLAK